MAVDVLMQNGASVNARDMYEQIPLHKAAINGDNAMIHLLMWYSDCDVKAKDVEGKTAADIDRENGHQHMELYLVLILKH